MWVDGRRGSFACSVVDAVRVLPNVRVQYYEEQRLVCWSEVSLRRDLRVHVGEFAVASKIQNFTENTKKWTEKNVF